MSGCRSCSGRAPEPCSNPLSKAEKLEKRETSGNPRYPHVLVGKQAIYTDEHLQMIVKVVADESDESCDSFTLSPQRVPQRFSRKPLGSGDPSRIPGSGRELLETPRAHLTRVHDRAW